MNSLGLNRPNRMTCRQRTDKEERPSTIFRLPVQRFGAMIGNMANGHPHRKTTIQSAIAVPLILAAFCCCSHKQQESPLDWIEQVPVSSNDTNSPEYEQTLARLRHPDDKTLQSLLELVRDVAKSGNDSKYASEHLINIYGPLTLSGRMPLR